MMTAAELLHQFIRQADSRDLKTAHYPKEWHGLTVKVSFGMGSPARVPWIAFTAPEMSVSNGYYPVYLYYKDLKTLILAYGISETNESKELWPDSITEDAATIEQYFGKTVPRYGDSSVFTAYEVQGDLSLTNKDSGAVVSDQELAANLDKILEQYQQATSAERYDPTSTISQGVFYLEKQLEDFIIYNWKYTDLGEKYDLIVEEGVVVSQQYRTDIGPIDILAKEKATGNHVVIELKKSQSSDQTIGQIARYMGWVEEQFGDKDVKGVIISKSYDKKLELALKRVNGVEVYVYEVDFRLKKLEN